MRTIGFLGRSGSGKTTLIERLLPALRERGIAVVVVKHAHHPNIQLEPAGKDTFRFRQAGAAAVALVAPDQIFTLESRTTEPTLDEILARLPRADLAIVESWRTLALDYVAVIGDTGEPPAPAPTARCVALVSDHAVGAQCGSIAHAPRFRRDDVTALADAISGWMGS